MKRFDLLNHYIERYNYKSYLEIGTQIGNCIQEVVCDFKVGVDPEYNENVFNNCTVFHQMTSDEFFKINTDTFDLVFIDGLHEYKQVLRDVVNALECLNSYGTIVIHDCNPLSEESQLPIYLEDGKWCVPHVKTWNGDVWKAWVGMRSKREDLEMTCYDLDEGCGVINNGIQELIELDKDYHELEYADLEANRKYYLNLEEWHEK